MVVDIPFRISREEITYHQKSFLEQCKLMGRYCKLQVPSGVIISETTTTPKYEYESDKFDYYILLDSDPKRVYLDAFGFSKDDKDTRPLLAHCPVWRDLGKDEVVIDPEPIDPPEDPNKVQRLGTITGKSDKSDAYVRDDLVRVDIIDGTILEIQMHHSSDTSDVTMEKYLVKKVVRVEDHPHVIANLVPYRSYIDVPRLDTPSSGGSKPNWVGRGDD